MVMATYRLFPSTNGPSTATSFAGTFLSGVVFSVTQPTMYISGYYWWVCNSGGQPTSSQTFALWNAGGGGSAHALVTSGTTTSGALTAGQWNYVPLSTPIPLSENQLYVAATGFTGSFPDTNNQFGAGNPYAAGITNGPLFAYSDTGGSAPTPGSPLGQGLFASGAGTDPTAVMPGGVSNSANFWIDVQITNAVPSPSTATYRLFPSTPSPWALSGTAGGNYTLTVEFKLSQACYIKKLWLYSGSGCAILPSRCGIFSVASQLEVAGSDNSSPSWFVSPGNAASAGGGWCYVDYSSTNLVLPPGSYRAAVYSVGASNWFSYTNAYWSTSLGSTGVANGPISAPGNSTADAPGQSGSLSNSWGYPNAVSNSNGFWIDMEVAPTVSIPGAFMKFFP